MKEISQRHQGNAPRKILFVNLETQMSGAEKSLLLNIQHLPSGFVSQVACPKNGALADQLQEMGIRIVPLPQAPTKWNNVFVWMIYFGMANLRILWIILRNKQQLIHANTTKAALTVLLAVIVMRVKLIWHVRDANCPSWILRVCSAYSSRIIAISKAMRSWLTAKGVEDNKIEVIYNSVDIIENRPRNCNVKPQRVFTFANVGQFVPWKKQMLFIDAAEVYLAKGHNAKFLIVGGDVFGRDSKYAQMLQKRIERSRFSHCLQIIPWQKNIDAVWQQIDCLVHTADKEPFGRVLIEAMERHIPVIAADSFGPSELLEDCITGLLFDPDDVHDLCCCMEIVSQNPPYMSDIVRAGYQYIRRSHDIRINIRQIQAVYSQLLVA